MLVPVEMGSSGTSLPLPLNTARLVPSPPRVTMHATPASTMAAAARVESWGSPVTGISTGHTRSRVGPIFRQALGQIPAGSGM